MYKKRKVEPVVFDAEDGSESIVSGMLERMESSLSHMTLSQSSSDDPSFRVNITPTDCTEYVEIRMKRTISTHRYCCLCGNTSDLIIIPQKARMQSFIKRRVFIPDGNRCCQNHLINKRFYDESLSLIRVYSNWTLISSVELSNMMENFSVECDSTLLNKMEDYRLSDEKLLVLTGLKWENVIELQNWLVSMRNTDARSVTQAIIVFLIKLRTGDSNKLISTILDINEEQLVSKYCEQVIQSFEKDILPLRFGLNAVSRADLIENHTSSVAKKLHNDLNDKLILICDGTYARHEKSSNNEYQRKSYSGQKKVPLCKPFTICTTDGYIVDMLGPYYANQNDATIMRDIIDNPDGICHLLEPGDAFVVDRGFRDVKGYLEEKNYKVLMPALKGKQNQLTTAESNASRNVTKIRWAVEAVHGMLKQKYHLLDQRIDNKMLPRVGSFFKIALFLHNTYSKRLTSDSEFLDKVIETMQSQNNVVNTIAEDVQKNGWQRKKLPFQTISSETLEDFPEMTENDLRIFFTGPYQLKQAVSYLAEMLDETGNLTIQYVTGIIGF
ncbi:uncharacterized protein LOC130677729 [Microplitis mediator]|uniref:uncharacterized protein LOC130677729 n=1 Tax=Microplitis mediator TaxID=375433 RepID=UPI002556B9BD|nr:uncharacterized protein LOC130677729 [Microplitis mediator]